MHSDIKAGIDRKQSMCSRQRAGGWTSVLTAVLLGATLAREVYAYDRAPDGQLFSLLQRKEHDVVSEKARAAQALHLNP